MSAQDRARMSSTAIVHASSSSSSPSLLYVLKQHSPFTEKLTRNGIQKDVYVVIKNSPFIVQIGKTSPNIDLNHVAFDVSLFYDTEAEKNVDFVKAKPLEFKALPTDAGDQVTLELRIKVLTSQHEDMFFRVRIQGYDPVTKAELPELRCATEAIKVISKPEQLKKRQPTKKRTVNDMLIDAITRIEKQQNEQQNILQQILETKPASKEQCIAQPPRAATMTASVGIVENKDSLTGASFETLFGHVLKHFAHMDVQQKEERIRKLVRNATSRETECLSELVDMLSAQGFGNELGRETTDLSHQVLSVSVNPLVAVSAPKNPLALTQNNMTFAPAPFTPFNHIHLEKDCLCTSAVSPQAFVGHSGRPGINTSSLIHNPMLSSGNMAKLSSSDLYVNASTFSPSSDDSLDFLSQQPFLHGNDFIF